MRRILFLLSAIAFVALALLLPHHVGHTVAPFFALGVVNVLGAAAPSKRKRGGGNLFAFQQIKIQSDGTFAAWTGSDSLGDVATSWHILGTHEDTGWSRDDKGRWSMEVTLLEMDKDHRNLLNMVAPITAQSLINTDPDFTAEDGTVIAGSELTGRTTFPYFVGWYLDAPIGGKAQARVQVFQFEPTTSWTNKITEWSKPKIKCVTVDANGFVTTLPTGITQFSTLTAPTLTAPYQHGKDLEGT